MKSVIRFMLLSVFSGMSYSQTHSFWYWDASFQSPSFNSAMDACIGLKNSIKANLPADATVTEGGIVYSNNECRYPGFSAIWPTVGGSESIIFDTPYGAYRNGSECSLGYSFNESLGQCEKACVDAPPVAYPQDCQTEIECFNPHGWVTAPLTCPPPDDYPDKDNGPPNVERDAPRERDAGDYQDFNTPPTIDTNPGIAISGGGGCKATSGVGNPINIATGNKYQQEFDFISTLGSQPLVVTRTYNSRADYRGHFGNNWSSNLDVQARIDVSGDEVGVQLPSGKVFYFTRDGTNWITTPDIHSTLTEDTSNYVFHSVDQMIYTFDLNGNLIEISNAQRHTLTYAYNPSGDQLTNVTDHYGNELTISYHSTRNVIESISVMGQSYTYHYDESGGDTDGNLIGVDYPADGGGVVSRQYLYENENFPNALTGIIDEEGKRFATYGYNSLGRANLSEHNGGAERVSVDYADVFDAIDPRVIVTNASGHQWIYHLETTGYDFTRVKYIEGLGSANCAAANTHNTYASNGFVVASTNGLGVNGPGYVTQFNYNTQGYVTEKTTGYQWNNNSITNELADLVETADMQKVDTLWHPTLPKADLITLSGKNQAGLWESYREINPEYLSSGHLSSWTMTDLTSFTAPYLTTGQTRTWSYNYTYHDSEEAQVATRTVDGPGPGNIDVSTSTYDDSGRLTQTTNALNHTVSYSNHNSAGLPQTVTDVNGIDTVLVYDARNRLIQTTAASDTPLATTTQLDYYANGLLRRVTSAANTAYSTWIEYQYNDARQLIEIKNNLGDYVTLTPSVLNGQWIDREVFDSSHTLQQKQQRAQDDLGRILSLLYANGAIERVRYGYDERNNLTSTVLGGDTTTEVIRLYDALNRLQQINHADGGVSQYEYDSAGNIAKVIDQRNLETSYQYDGLGNLMQVISPDTGTTHYTYDSVGNRLTQTDARNVVLNYSYDALNRLISVHNPADSSGTIISYTYDDTVNNNVGIGRLTHVDDLSGETRYTYDALGQLVQKISTIDNRHYRWSYLYDVAGNIERLYYPSGRTVRYERDDLQRISAIYTTSWVGATEQLVANNFTYLPFGPMQSFSYANGVSHFTGYDLYYRINTIFESGFETSIFEMDYQYDSIGNINAIDDVNNPDNSQQFSYDGERRIDVATGSYGVIDYDYDLVGNRTQRSITDPNQVTTIESYTYASTSNRLENVQVSPSGVTQVFQYSATGNVTTDPRTNATLTYNSYNRLSGNTGGTAGSGDYQQNGAGQRTSKMATTQSVLTDSHFFYDNNAQLLAEYNGLTQAVIREYIYANGQLITYVTPNPQSDSDGDGIDDDWEQQFFNDLSRTGLTDSDGDGYTDFEEYTAGSLVNNAASYPLTGRVTDLDDDGLLDSWELTHFGNLYRTGTGDFDNDGISDNDEYLAGTNPNQAAILAFTHPDVAFAYTMDTINNSTTLNDETGYQNAVITNAVSASGVFGNSLYFDGNSDVDMGNQDATFAGADKQWTISLWAKVSDVSGITRLVSQIGTNLSPDEFQFHLSVNDGKVVIPIFMQPQSAAYRVYETSTALISNNQWNHIVVTYDGSVDSNDGLDRVTLHVNGINQPIAMTSVGALGDMLTGTAHLALGAEITGDGTRTTTGQLDGNIDQLRIFSRGLLPFEAGNLYEEWSRLCVE